MDLGSQFTSDMSQQLFKCRFQLQVFSCILKVVIKEYDAQNDLMPLSGYFKCGYRFFREPHRASRSGRCGCGLNLKGAIQINLRPTSHDICVFRVQQGIKKAPSGDG